MKTSPFDALRDRALPAWRAGFAAAALAGKPRSSLVAVVLEASVSPDGWPMAFVATEEEVRARLRAVDTGLEWFTLGIPPLGKPPARMPFALVVRRFGDGYEFETSEFAESSSC